MALDIGDEIWNAWKEVFDLEQAQAKSGHTPERHEIFAQLDWQFLSEEMFPNLTPEGRNRAMCVQTYSQAPLNVAVSSRLRQKTGL